MSVVHLFNPQNDLALANGSPTFTPPLSALQLANAGACLPMWYGKSDEYFFGAVNAGWYDEICAAFEINVKPKMFPAEDDIPLPWGWSAHARRYLADCGFDPHLLPSEEDIHRWRGLSSRERSAKLIADFLEKNPVLVNGNVDESRPFITGTVDSALRHINSVGIAMIKLPWSNAGRGQQVSDRTTPDELVRRLTGMIRRQGSVEITPFYRKSLDFAMLWDAEGEFAGYSLFETDSHGGWTKNILISDSEIEHVIEENAGKSIDFEKIINDLSHIINEARKEDNFPLPTGVDFIVGDDSSASKVIVPVEINRRRTMGHVSHALAQRFMSKDSRGTFSIVPASNLQEPFHSVGNCRTEGLRLAEGKLDIVPPGGNFRFIVEVLQNRK